MTTSEALANIVRILRSRTLATEFALFYASVVTLLDTIGAVLFPVEPMAASAAGVDEDQLVEAREALLDAEAELQQAFGATGAEAIDPALLSLLISVAVKLIEAWLAKRNG